MVATRAETKKISAPGQNRSGQERIPPRPLSVTPSQKSLEKEKRIMSKKNNRINVPEAREAMDKFKMEAASDLAVSTPS